ncbi:MAG TPA: outer membrane lipoprotein-sorting protein [Verrucomicrobiae bacterium]|nr:outer membrane lipoprotein-sorting protein [Verrucomicrobiae bacterium]
MRSKIEWGLGGWWVAALLLLPVLCGAQPKSDLAPPRPLDPAEGERQARSLLARLLEQKPEQAATNTGVLKIRNAEGAQHEVSARFDIVPRAANWLNVYEALTGTNLVKLTIVHSDGKPNQYLPDDSSVPLSAQQIMAPFAGSDFWIADLGLEFLHWPNQRILKTQMRKGLSCDVLQSVNPQPTDGGYYRVVSWIAINRPEDIVIVHAEAYDAHDKLLKEFDPKKVEKVNGVWQLEEMEIRNRQTGSRTRIEFNL